MIVLKLAKVRLEMSPIFEYYNRIICQKVVMCDKLSAFSLIILTRDIKLDYMSTNDIIKL